MMKWIGWAFRSGGTVGQKNAPGAPLPRVVTPALSSHLIIPQPFIHSGRAYWEICGASLFDSWANSSLFKIAQPPCVRARKGRKKKRNGKTKKEYGTIRTMRLG